MKRRIIKRRIARRALEFRKLWRKAKGNHGKWMEQARMRAFIDRHPWVVSLVVNRLATDAMAMFVPAIAEATRALRHGT